MLNMIKKVGIINRANDEILYEYVLDEMEQGVRIKGLWAKALAHSDGMESKAKSMYMQYRVQSIKDQFNALQIAYDEMSRKKLFDYIKNGFKDPVLEVEKARQIKKEEKLKREREEQKQKEELEKLELLTDYQEKMRYQNKTKISNGYNSFEKAKQEWREENKNKAKEQTKKEDNDAIQETQEKKGFGNMFFEFSIIVFFIIILYIVTS